MISTRTGFAGGHLPHPSYQQVCTKETGHAETVEVTYDLRLLSTKALLTEFFVLHDSCIDRRANGGQYRSAIFLEQDGKHADEQEYVAKQAIRKLQDNGVLSTTEISRIRGFFAASSRHQQYCSVKGIVPQRRVSEEIRQILTL
ncbi:peptide-methionine (S)-S-oxide reductase [Neolewinella agarilytica]|uniref:peptide-methionine (S)-S-oxide reductase n=1 Tax=Neolewinella agarilytica TaxID=478744 RepID=A0A1H9EYV2_9BACT|nr:peptide-methionine (S)-S-oxide reductase [Neolewinella agarilytica]